MAAPSENVSSTTSASAPPSSSPSAATSSETHTCPYKDCNRSFSKKYNLKAHLRLHTGEQPFECDRPDCKKKFKWRSSLSSHSIWHTRKDSGSICSPADPKSAKSSQDLSKKLPTTLLKTDSSPPRPAKSTAHSGAVKSADSSSKVVRKAAAKAATVPAGNCATNVFKVEQSASLQPGSGSKKKRPRSEPARKGKGSVVSVKMSDASSTDGSMSTVPSLSEFCFSSDGMESGAETSGKDGKRKVSGPSSKKRKTVVSKKSDTTESCAVGPTTVVDADIDIFSSPGSPMTSESGLSEHSLELELFTCDVLQPLMGCEGDGLALGGEDVSGLLGGDGDVGMFGYDGSGTCGALNGLDTRFGPFDLDNLASF